MQDCIKTIANANCSLALDHRCQSATFHRILCNVIPCPTSAKTPILYVDCFGNVIREFVGPVLLKPRQFTVIHRQLWFTDQVPLETVGDNRFCNAWTVVWGGWIVTRTWTQSTAWKGCLPKSQGVSSAIGIRVITLIDEAATKILFC